MSDLSAKIIRARELILEINGYYPNEKEIPSNIKQIKNTLDRILEKCINENADGSKLKLGEKANLPSNLGLLEAQMLAIRTANLKRPAPIVVPAAAAPAVTQPTEQEVLFLKTAPADDEIPKYSDELFQAIENLVLPQVGKVESKNAGKVGMKLVVQGKLNLLKQAWQQGTLDTNDSAYLLKLLKRLQQPVSVAREMPVQQQEPSARNTPTSLEAGEVGGDMATVVRLVDAEKPVPLQATAVQTATAVAGAAPAETRPEPPPRRHRPVAPPAGAVPPAIPHRKQPQASGATEQAQPMVAPPLLSQWDGASATPAAAPAQPVVAPPPSSGPTLLAQAQLYEEAFQLLNRVKDRQDADAVALRAFVEMYSADDSDSYAKGMTIKGYKELSTLVQKIAAEHPQHVSVAPVTKAVPEGTQPTAAAAPALLPSAQKYRDLMTNLKVIDEIWKDIATIFSKMEPAKLKETFNYLKNQNDDKEFGAIVKQLLQASEDNPALNISISTAAAEAKTSLFNQDIIIIEFDNPNTLKERLGTLAASGGVKANAIAGFLTKNIVLSQKYEAEVQAEMKRSAAAATPAIIAPDGNEKEEKRGFFARLFSRDKQDDAPAAAPQADAAAPAVVAPASPTRSFSGLSGGSSTGSMGTSASSDSQQVAGSPILPGAAVDAKRQSTLLARALGGEQPKGPGGNIAAAAAAAAAARAARNKLRPGEK